VRISIFAGDLCDVPAEALCTSTNPRLSLAMGTGGSVRSRGGYSILRACEAIAANGHLPTGSAHITTAGDLPAKAIIHCVASNAHHQSSPDIVRACVRNALACAAEARCSTIAFPVFASGHAGFNFERSLRLMIEELAGDDIDHAYIVFNDADRIDAAVRVIRESGQEPEVHRSAVVSEERSNWFQDE